jgi:hypothetical protein
VGFSGVASVVTLGGAPAVYGWLLRKRRKKYDHLFRQGLLTSGTIRSIPAADVGMSTMIRYEYEVGGINFVGLDAAAPRNGGGLERFGHRLGPLGSRGSERLLHRVQVSVATAGAVAGAGSTNSSIPMFSYPGVARHDR